mmetsp:Transcript_4015/g.9556  ORF Transcript_4015/g.9556 Transcript_4015/m.9556 type:complete len:356 (-) Transcript_4015:153-1220(-)
MDVALNAVGSDVATVVVHGWDAVQKLENAAGRTNSLHELGENGDQGREGEHRLKCEQHVRHETTDAHLVLEDKLTTIPHRHQDARISSQVSDGGETTGNPSTALDDQVRHVNLVGVVADFLLFHHVGADSADVAQGLVGLGTSVGESNKLLLGQNLHAEPLEEHAHGNDRNQGQHDKRELPVVRENGDKTNHDLAQRDEPTGQVGRHDHLNDLRVGGQPVQQLTDTDGVKERHILTQHVTQHQRAETAGAAGSGDGVQYRGEKGQHAIAHVDAQQVERESGHRGFAHIHGGVMYSIDHHSHKDVLRHVEEGGDRRQEGRHDHKRQLGLSEFQETKNGGALLLLLHAISLIIIVGS